MEDRYLFKAKIKENNNTGYKELDWIIGNLVVEQSTGRHFIIDLSHFDENTKLCDVMIEVDPSTICKCTGIRDKTGKLICDNDIIKAWSQGTCAKGKIKQRIDGTWIMYPAWQKGEMWYLCPDNNGETTVEVIGNKFDNPELLEV
jgi:uncharacterized phage protein (TIGR01671 family)